MSKKEEDIEAKTDIVVDGSQFELKANIQLVGLDVYKDAIKKYKSEIVELVKEGTISEQTGAKLIVDAEYSFYQQMVQVSYQ